MKFKYDWLDGNINICPDNDVEILDVYNAKEHEYTHYYTKEVVFKYKDKYYKVDMPYLYNAYDNWSDTPNYIEDIEAVEVEVYQDTVNVLKYRVMEYDND